MAEYGREQRKQKSRAIANSETKSNQLKNINNRIVLQMCKHHHDPRKKKYSKKGLGDLQVRISERQLELINQGVDRKAAKRQAKEEIKD